MKKSLGSRSNESPMRQPFVQLKRKLSRRFRQILILGLSTLVLEPWSRSTSGLAKSFVVGLDNSISGHDEQLQRRRLTEKPVVYTFFHGVSNRTDNTGMTEETDEKLLQTWREEWSRTGWSPAVLTLVDAKRHKDYEAINDLLDGGPYGEYDRYCFLRWLAIASAGGGFAADYDTFPLDFVTNSLPNEGKLTVHEGGADGGVPSVVSGNAEEYTRFAWLLARNAAVHKSEVHWSDMKAMQDLFKKSKGADYVLADNVKNALDVLQGRDVDQAICTLVGRKHFIHFSHYSILFGKVPPGSGAQDRENIGKEWLKDWWKTCNTHKPMPALEPIVAPKAAKTNIAKATEDKTEEEATQSKEVDDLTGEDSRPVVYTFVGHSDASKLTKEEQSMLRVWLKSWYEIGWEPLVLFYDAAERHKEYAKLYNELTSKSKTATPQVYIRYLAMANVGGGWLSDFDVIPLSKFAKRALPNGGKITIHESSKEGAGVPSLVSGSAEEYMRLSRGIVANARQHGNSPSWDDAQSLQEMHKSSNGTAYFVTSNVIPGQEVLQTSSVDRTTCNRLEKKYAVHASHEAFPKDADNKAKFARDWVVSWRGKCLSDETISSIQ